MAETNILSGLTSADLIKIDNLAQFRAFEDLVALWIKPITTQQEWDAWRGRKGPEERFKLLGKACTMGKFVLKLMEDPYGVLYAPHEGRSREITFPRDQRPPKTPTNPDSIRSYVGFEVEASCGSRTLAATQIWFSEVPETTVKKKGTDSAGNPVIKVRYRPSRTQGGASIRQHYATPQTIEARTLVPTPETREIGHLAIAASLEAVMAERGLTD